jgi:copper chaperone
MADTVLLQVEGMTCAGCEQRIGNVLKRLDGVRRVGVDHSGGQVRVVFDPARVASAVLAKRIEQAGYRVTGSHETQQEAGR